MIPNILSIAGTDCTGGAGIQADIKAICANKGYAMSVITAVVAQNTQGVKQVQMMSEQLVRAQLKAVFDDVRVDAVKIGMLGTASMIKCVADVLAEYKPANIVLDPVMVAKSGDRLLDKDAVDALKALLIPNVDLITPNLPEAADLLATHEAQNREEMLQQAQQLNAATLLKGGHLSANDSPDLLYYNDDAALSSAYNSTHYKFKWFETARIDTKNSHGTGCTLSSTIATYLGRDYSLEDACAQAKQYLTGALQAAHQLDVGNGNGPVHHFYNYY